METDHGDDSSGDKDSGGGRKVRSGMARADDDQGVCVWFFQPSYFVLVNCVTRIDYFK